MRKQVRNLTCLTAMALCLAACATFHAAQQPKAHLDSAALPKIDALVQKVVDDGNAPGAVLIVGVGDDILMRKAYGNRMNDPRHEPMTVDTLFDLASLTKATTTATAVMLLVQDGKIRLDDPISKYVREFDYPSTAPITVRQLLTHESGLPAYTNAEKVAELYGPRPNPDGLIKRISQLNRVAPPGTKYVYSCLNYLTLARAVQNVTGENMDSFLRRRLWNPLGMKDTTFYPTAEQRARTAPTIYNPKTGEFRRGDVHDPLAYYSCCESYSSGNAGVFSTVDDMSIYARMILNGGELDGVRIYAPETWQLVTTDQAAPGLEERTCGWGVVTEKDDSTPLNQSPDTCCLSHTGYTGTILWMDKLSKAYVILFTNCVYPDDNLPRKRPLFRIRRQVIATVIDNLDIYKDLRKKTTETAAN